MIIKAIKKPKEITAVKFIGGFESFKECHKFMGISNLELMVAYFAVNKKEIHIETLEGVMKAQIGDYIIKGTLGEFYPCKPDVFDDVYDITDPPQSKTDNLDWSKYIDVIHPLG